MKIAIDVVLLPSAGMTAKAIAINRELLKTAAHKIVLGQQDCLPHISLCMGVIDSADLPKAQDILQAVAQASPALELVAEHMRADTILTGEIVSGLRLRNTPELQSLQKIIMNKLWPYLAYDVDASMLYNPAEIEEVTYTWIKNYAAKHDDPAKFSPHLTVGLGETDAFTHDFPLQFSAPTLALGQLGNYCTFRKVFAAFELSQPHEAKQ